MLSPGSAAGASFERLGPYGGTVRSLLIASKSDVVYMGTKDGQLFKSMDGGIQWRLLYPGLKRRQFVVDTIVEDPADPNHIYAGGWDVRSDGGGLFESRDGGQSWTPVALPKPNVAVRGFAISKGKPGHMITGTNAGVFVSSDAGKTWQQSGIRMGAFLQAESVAIDPVDPRFLFVGTWHLGYRSGDFGKTWVQNEKGMILDSDVFSIAIDDRNPKNMFASACTGLYRSIDRGLSWTRLKVFPKSFLVRAQVVYISPADSTRVFGGTTEGLFISSDSGKTWNRMTPDDWIINAIQVDSHNGAILLGTEVHGVIRSDDGGRTWTASNTGYANRSISRVLPDKSKPGRFYVGEVSEGKHGGFFLYDRPINDWVPLSPREIPGEGLLSMLVLPGNRGRIAGTARGVFLQPPGSDEWHGLPGAIGKLSVFDLALDEASGRIFAGTNNGVYRARVDDLQFQAPRNYSVIPRVFSLLGTHKPDRILAASHMGVLRSTNSGESWTFSSVGIPNLTIVESLVSSPSDPEHLFAGTTAGLFESKDGGNTWLRAPDGRLGVDIPSVIFLDSRGLRILAADNTLGGVFLSEDSGVTWEKIEDPRFGSPIKSLAQDPLHPSVIYLGTATEGVYRLDLSRTQGEKQKLSAESAEKKGRDRRDSLFCLSLDYLPANPLQTGKDFFTTENAAQPGGHSDLPRGIVCDAGAKRQSGMSHS